MTGDTPKRKNERQSFRWISDAEYLGQELEAAIRQLNGIGRKLVPHHEAEFGGPPTPAEGDPVEAIMADTNRMLGAVKGRMYLERATRGLDAEHLAPGTGWSGHTIRGFEQRDGDGLVSSLLRYAAGLRHAGVPGHIEIHWVPDEVPTTKGDHIDDAA